MAGWVFGLKPPYHMEQYRRDEGIKIGGLSGSGWWGGYLVSHHLTTAQGQMNRWPFWVKAESSLALSSLTDLSHPEVPTLLVRLTGSSVTDRVVVVSLRKIARWLPGV